jgi:aminoglycoside phosphotransferase (APT) family kinase protein
VDDADAIAAAIAQWSSARFGVPVDVAESPTLVATGYDNRICLVQLSGAGLPDEWTRPLVARIARTADRLATAEREATIQNWCVLHDVPAPAVLAVIPPGDTFETPVQIMERAPGTTVVDAFTRTPRQAPALIDRLAALQAALHQTPVDDWPRQPDGGDSLLDRRLAGVRYALSVDDAPALRQGLDAVERLAPALGAAESVACHGDYHPLNVLVDGDRLTIIDWTDAGLGDRHGDVARTLLLFDLAAVGADKRSERALLRVLAPWLRRRYRRAYERHLPLDPARLRLWEPAHYLQLWAGVVLTDGQGLPARLGPWLQSQFDSSLARVNVR